MRDRATRSTRATCASSASGRSRSPTTTRRSTPRRRERQDPGRLGRDLALRRLPAVRRRPARRAGALEPGLTPLVRADRLAERLGLGEVWIKNDAANPTHSFKDRVVAVALAKARELGFDTVACASTGNLANAVAAHAAAAGLDSYVFVPADLEEQKLLATGVYGTTLVGVERQLRRRQPALHASSARSAAVGVRQRQPAPLLRRGLEDARLRDRRAARLAAARPGRLPDRVGLAVHEDRPRLHRVARPGPASTASCRPSTAPRRRAAARSPRRSPTATTSAVRSARTRSPRASRSANPADGPYALDLARQHRRRGRVGHRRGDPRRDPAARRDDRDLHRDRRRRDDRDAGEARRGRRDRAATSGSSSCITGEGLKTLDATREGFEMRRDRADAGRRSRRSSDGCDRRGALRASRASAGPSTDRSPPRWP